MIAKLLLAVIIGGAVGYEREFKNRPAGFRTHILVCIGATVISMIQMYTIRDISAMIMNHSQLAGGIKSDVGRMGAQVISGVGFLGAGTIIHERGSVKGLRSEEHTSELQSRQYLVCRLLLEKKKACYHLAT